MSSWWARATSWTTTSPPTTGSHAPDEPPVVVTHGISPTLSNALVIQVQPLSGPAGINPLTQPASEQAGEPAPGPHVVIDIRDPLENRDEEVPQHLQAPARIARDGSNRRILAVRFDVPPDAAPAVHHAARQLGVATPDQPPVTTGQTWQVGARMGLQHGACAFVTQLAGRSVGLAVTSALRRTDAGPAYGCSMGVVLASGLLFGSRAATLITRALGLEDPAPACRDGDASDTEAAHVVKASRMATALTVTPMLTQALLPILGTYCAGTAVGVNIATLIAGRLIAALVRDGLTQSVSGLLGSMDVVTQHGKRPDTQTVRDAYDPLRINLAVMLYTICSGLLLIGSSDPMTQSIGPEETPSTLRQRMQRGMGAVLASSLNEGLDGFLLNLARAAAAIECGLRLVPSGWLAQQEEAAAARAGRPRPRTAASQRATPSPPTCWQDLCDLAERIQAHAGMRMTFGTFTADPWNAAAEIVGTSTPYGMAFRTVGALLNGQTGRRGFTVERGRQPTRMEIEIRNLKAQAKIAKKINETWFMNTRADARFPAVREALRRAFRDRLLAGGAIPREAPDRAEQLEQLDLAIQDSAGTWLDHQADEALKQHERSLIREQQQGPYHFRTSSVVNEMVMVEAASLETSSVQSEAPTQDPSALTSPQASPPPGYRTLARHLQVPPARGLRQPDFKAPVTRQRAAPQPEHLQPGQAIRIDGHAVRFIGRRADADGPPEGLLEVRATQAVQAIGWTVAPAAGEFTYLVDPRYVTLSHVVDEGIGLPFDERALQ